MAATVSLSTMRHYVENDIAWLRKIWDDLDDDVVDSARWLGELKELAGKTSKNYDMRDDVAKMDRWVKKLAALAKTARTTWENYTQAANAWDRDMNDKNASARIVVNRVELWMETSVGRGKSTRIVVPWRRTKRTIAQSSDDETDDDNDDNDDDDGVEFVGEKTWQELDDAARAKAVLVESCVDKTFRDLNL